MDNRNSKKLIVFITISFLVIAIVAYLGHQTINYKVLQQQYSQEIKGQNELSNIENIVENLMNNEEQRLLAMDEADMPIRFVLDNQQLIYPDATQSLSMKEHSFIQKIAPIIEAPSLLYQSYLSEGQSIPEFGWYIRQDYDLPLWIFWIKKDQQIIGYSVSYPSLMSQLFNELIDVKYSAESLITIEENGQLLFQSHANDGATTLYAEKRLPFPLNYWQLNYYAERYNGWIIYTLGGAVILLLCGILGWLFFRLYQEYQRIQNSARQQVNFVSQVSHELKTPLTNISLFAELLQEEPLNDTSQKYREIIHSESLRLTRLIQNILSFTKKREPVLSTFDLVELLQNIAAVFQPSLEAKGLALEMILPQHCEIYSDQDAVTQIINNLMSNAEKYGASGKKINLSLEIIETEVLIKVRDYGEGISHKYLNLVFKPFYRVHDKMTEGVSGTGIGLTIAEQLAESIQGKITIHPKEQGIEFCVHLKSKV